MQNATEGIDVPTGPQGQKRPGDAIGCAVAVATGELEDTQTKNQTDGRKGGHVRARNLTPERRKEIAKNGAAALWRTGKKKV